MKRLLALLLILALAGVVNATSLNFQNPGDVTSIRNITDANPTYSTVSWSESTTGDNNYASVGAFQYGVSYSTTFILKSPYPTTYAAATHLGTSDIYSGPVIALYDNSYNVIYSMHGNHVTTGRYRYWVEVSGGIASVYRDSTQVAVSPVLSVNPSYIGFGLFQSAGSNGWHYAYWDDYVYGNTEEKLVLGLPESDGDKFIILDDFVNDANDGLYNTTSGTQENANSMIGTWSRGNSSVGTPLENQSITLKHYDTGVVYWTGYTGNAYTGTFTIPIKTDVIDAGAPDGYYVLTSPGTFSTSNMILKRSQGATITFDKDDYSVDDKATVTWDVQTGDYWDASLYSYRVLIRDIYGVEKTSYAVTERTGSFEYLFNSADDPGVYIAVITATQLSGGNPLYIGTDYAELSQYGVITGYVKDGADNAISGANVTFDQGSYTSVLTSGYDGNFTSLPFFIAGTELLCNITATGYRQHYYTILPRSTKTKYINFTLPVDPTPFTGLGIDGVAMEGYLTPDTINIVNGYGNPIPFALVNVTNITTMESYSKTASASGWYMCDVGSTCDLVFNQTYDIEGSKVGYQNSSIYQKKPFGVLT